MSIRAFFSIDLKISSFCHNKMCKRTQSTKCLQRFSIFLTIIIKFNNTIIVSILRYSMRILLSWGWSPKKTTYIFENLMKEWEGYDHEITSINYREELGINWPYSASELDTLYSNKDSRLFSFYNKIEQLLKTHDVLLVYAGNIYHPLFLLSLKNVYTVYVGDDDPDSSAFLSEPYAYAFNHSFTCAVVYDETTRMLDKYQEWGARRSNWRPAGICKGFYDETLTEDKIDHQNRDVDLIFIGSARRRVKRLAAIKNAFPQMHLYGRGWGVYALKGLLPNSDRRPMITQGLWRTKDLPQNQYVPLFQRSKIGINIHYTHGPLNGRLYDIPANGVMQICDCLNGLGDVFDIDKEVIGYRSINEAIELIDYYLEHEEERIKIAKAGFKRVMNDYNQGSVFHKMKNQIICGMKKDGFTYYKDGTRIP